MDLIALLIHAFLFNPYVIAFTAIFGLLLVSVYASLSRYKLSLLALFSMSILANIMMMPENLAAPQWEAVLGLSIWMLSNILLASLGNFVVFNNTLTPDEYVLSWHLTCIYSLVLSAFVWGIYGTEPHAARTLCHAFFIFVMPPLSIYLLRSHANRPSRA